MESARNKYTEDERIYTTAIDSAGSFVTGSTSVLLTIIRDSDGYIYDFSDGSFKVSGWTTSSQPMTELDSTSMAGIYYYDFDASAQGIFGSQRNYIIRATCAAADNMPQEGYLKLGGWIDSVGLVGSGGSGMTSEQAQDIAEKVWKVILRGKETAKDILLRKSEFDATKDYVLYTKDDEMYTNLQKIKEDIKNIKFPEQKDYSDKIIKALDKLKPIDFNPILKKVLDKIELTVSFFNLGKNDIIKSIESQVYDDKEIKLLFEELKTTVSLLQEDIGDRIEVAKIISEEIAAKSEEIGENHQEKMAEMMSKLETESEENKKNIKKILLKMTELKFDSSNENLEDFEYIKESLGIIMDALNI